jgi:hypothetical protein
MRRRRGAGTLGVMTLLRVLVPLAACLAALLLGAPAAGAQSSACRGTFTVLHRDRVGTMTVPAGAYSVRATGVSCGGASALIGRFLADFDGVLPGGWTTAASGVGFTNPSTGASIVLGSPSGGGGGGSSRGGCPGTFTVEHADRIGALRLPAGAYRIATRRLSCAAASR